GLPEGNAPAQVERMPPLAMGFVVLEAHERQSADIHFLSPAVRLQHWQDRVEVGGLGGFEKVTVFVALASDVARKGVLAVGPPEARAVVFVEREDLLGERFGNVSLHGQIAVEDIVCLSPILQVETVTLAPVADTVAHDEVVSAMDGQPAVVTIPDGCANDRRATHRLPDHVIL